MSSSMLRGFLRIVVLKALADEHKSGYSLMKYVVDKMGTKPSPGSIYPLLEKLKKESLIDVKIVDKSKEYRLTQKGKQKLNEIEQKRTECLCNLIEGMKMLSAITGEDMVFPVAMVESIKRGEIPFKEINPEWDSVRSIIFEMMQQNKLNKNSKQIRNILSKTMKELKAI